MDAATEERRLQALRAYRLLDTPPEAAFDQLSHLATRVADTPISLITLVDERRQWFKSAQGMNGMRETPREQALCAYALDASKPLIVEDAQADDRFVDNPLVTGAPNIRYYAGIPLEVEPGVVLGTLCVIDREPRTLTDEQIDMLASVRDVVVSQMQLRRRALESEAAPGLVHMCAWCHNIQLADGSSTETSRRVSHGICPNCEKNMRSMRKLDA